MRKEIVISNGSAVKLSDIPVLDFSLFRNVVITQVHGGKRLSALFCLPGEKPGIFNMFAILAADFDGILTIYRSTVAEIFPCLTLDCPQAHMFEREIFEQWSISPEGHPWLKPLRFHAPYYNPSELVRNAVAHQIRPGDVEFFSAIGTDYHEVAVGPVHAGVIEPGHFRFQCHGERVLYLQIALGYQHRGIEHSLIGGPDKTTLHQMETAAGDTSIGHATCYSQICEALAGVSAPNDAQTLRAMALELERLANHVGDMGALAKDVGFLPTSSFCGRLRGDLLNMTADLCGSRLGRGLVRPLGVGFDVDASMHSLVRKKLIKAKREVKGALDVLFSSPSVLSRFEHIGAITRKECLDLGFVGPTARCCGLKRDIRHNFPTGFWASHKIHVASDLRGDVFSRAYVRYQEILESLHILLDDDTTMQSQKTAGPLPQLAPQSLAVMLCEGWRGEICHVAITDAAGKFAGYKIIDPSFHNWTALALAMRGQEISDFPVCNKSFNLSYCGHDL